MEIFIGLEALLLISQKPLRDSYAPQELVAQVQVHPSCKRFQAYSSTFRLCLHGCVLNVGGNDRRGKTFSPYCTRRICGP